VPDIFLSYNREDQAVARRYAEAFAAEGFDVWWDTTLRAGEAYDEVTEAALNEAKAVVVLWSPRSVVSRWVRAEATQADRNKTLVPVTIEACKRPIMFELTQTADLSTWDGSSSDTAWQAFLGDVKRFLDAGGASRRPFTVAEPQTAPPRPSRPKDLGPSICVLPFINMSGDPEQEYFSDGISEDIITDLSKVSALWVAARNTAFAFKGQTVDVGKVAHQLQVTHVLEGSVRKSGNRVRITAQLIDAANGGHVWAERYDRDLSDIFAVQDEISKAIVTALRLRLAPEEKRAIEKRGTTNPDAYKFVLMARSYINHSSAENAPIIQRLYERAVQIDPDYAMAWSKLARLKMEQPGELETGREIAERALRLEPDSAEAHAAMSQYHLHKRDFDKAIAECELALRLDPDSFEVNNAAAQAFLQLGRYQDALDCYVRASNVIEGDWSNLAMAVQCYQGMGDLEGAKAMAARAIKRIEAHISNNPRNGAALAFGAATHAMLGEVDSAKDWAERAMIISPDDFKMRYNLACAMALLGEIDESIEYLEGYIERCSPRQLSWAKLDADLDPLREHPTFKKMIAAAERRISRETAEAGDAS